LNNKGFYIEKSFDKIIWKEIGFKNGNGTTTENNFYSFIDSEINSTLQYYRLKQVDFNGKFEYSKVVCVETYLINKNFILFQNYPNPFNSSTVITYQVPEKSFINISMYNVIGEKVHEIVNVEKDEGIFKEIFISEQIPSGVYFLRMKTSAGFSAINKITLIK
ncbi:MAG: T9SS type A sorting domain-containing protein, partial [Ignavibacteriaceae bacterium]|nr:T9SS type A sorting domain-containing protein [Ignavibacteriaceae bacterium]